MKGVNSRKLRKLKYSMNSTGILPATYTCLWHIVLTTLPRVTNMGITVYKTFSAQLSRYAIVLLEKLLVAQLLKFAALYGIQ
jgi:hypothetical protein